MGLFANLSFRKHSQLTKSPAHPELPTDAQVVEAAVSAQALEGTAAPKLTAAQAEAEELVRRVAQEVPTFVTVAVLEAATGRVLAGQWADPSSGAVEVAVANTEIVRQINLAIEALQLGEHEQLTDVLITLRHQLHLLRVLPPSGWLLYLAVRAQDTNPALVRAVSQLFDN